MQDLTITGVQCDLKWQDKEFNLAHISALLDESPLNQTDIIILPEMFTTGFSMESEFLAESMEGPSIKWMFALSQRKNAAVCGSVIIREDDNIYNRFIWVDPEGRLYQYDKHHLFSLLGEEKHYTPGTEHCLLEYKGWKIQPLICYDLRFPVWCRNFMEADLQIYVANWPERRSGHWKHLLKSRAIEGQCYVAGVNRFGKDSNDIHHTGDSGVYDYYGKEFVTIHGEEKVLTRALEMQGLRECRKKFPFLKDRDTFEIL
ncbi:MAG: amidohydrolase [Bacteroidetes bacterium]|nr:amidohydrolase [Bacteroidota bacterium]